MHYSLNLEENLIPNSICEKKSALYFNKLWAPCRMPLWPVHLSAENSLRSAEWFFTIYDTEEFYGKLSSQSALIGEL